MNVLIQQLLKMLGNESVKGKARNGNRAVTSIGVSMLLFIAYRQDGRMARIEQRLGITNAPISIPFTALTNSPSLQLVTDFNR